MHLSDEARWFIPGKAHFFVDAFSESTPRTAVNNSLILSGSGLSAYRYQERMNERFDQEQLEALERASVFVREFVTQGKWVLGICFGGQIAVHAVGGKIGRLPENLSGNAVTEAGWLPHELTQAGKEDEVFGSLPEVFYAPHLHNDFVGALPAVGTTVRSSFGSTTVESCDVLAIRRGYLGQGGLENKDQEYIHASVIRFANGARIYQIQPHPEMAFPERVNFLVRMNQWLADDAEMGQGYYQQALEIPDDPDLSVGSVITRFVEVSRRHEEQRLKIQFRKPEK